MTYSPPTRIYGNKIENRITSQIKTGYFILNFEDFKITKDRNDENVSHWEITEVVLVYYNLVNNNYQQNSRVLYTFFPNKSSEKS